MNKVKKLLAALLCAAFLSTNAYAAQPVEKQMDESQQKPVVYMTASEKPGEMTLFLEANGRYKKLAVLAPGIRANGWIAECWSSASIFEDGYKVELTISIQKKKKAGSSWSTDHTWSPATLVDYGTVSTDATWAMSSGYDYRVYATAKVYYKDGGLIETVSGYSSTIGR